MIDFDGCVVLFGFVDGYIYFDKSFVGDCWVLYELVGLLCEWFVVEKCQFVVVLLIVECVNVLIVQVVVFGMIVMCSYVDVDVMMGLLNLQVVMVVCE